MQPLATKPDGLVGSRIDRFAIKARLGSGGMGEVFLAEDTLLKRSVALKAIRHEHSADPEFCKRLLREAERASQLNNEHITRIYDVIEHGGQTLLVMEYVEGETLRSRLGKPLPIEELFRIAEQCLEGVAAAHEHGILHCDLKPENIIITPAGVAKILDFGLACPAPTQVTRDSSSLQHGGTLGYMAPEVLMGLPPAQTADIFSLGVILYEALMGIHPFQADARFGSADQIMDGPPLSNRRSAPTGLEAVIGRMLARDPAQRYQSCAEALADVHAVRQGQNPLAAKAGRRSMQVRRAAFLLAAIAFVILLWPLPPPPPAPGPRLLAVLPFQPADPNDSNSRALANGLTSTLTAQLGEVAEPYRLQIVPAADLRRQKAETARDARSMMGATLVLTGNLQVSGPTLRVTYSLVETSSLQQLRSGVITDEANRVFEVQNHVIGEVLNGLDIELAIEDRRQMTTRGTAQPRAYDYYLRGYGYLHVYDREESLDNAIAAFQSSIQIDPQFAPAYAGLGQAHLQKKNHSAEDVAQAREACSRAAELDKMLPDAEICLGMLLNETGEYDQAAQHLNRSIQLDDRREEPFRELARSYEGLRRLDDAEASLRRAIALQPQYWGGYKRLGKFYYDHGRSNEAIEEFKRVVTLAPGNFSNYSNLGGIYIMQGRYAEAVPMLEKSLSLHRSNQALSNLGVAYHSQGQYEQAIRLYEEALQLKPDDHTVVGNLGEAYAQLSGRRKESVVYSTRALALAENELRINRNDASILSYASLYAARLEHRSLAEQYRGRALALSAHDPQIRENSALVLAHFHEDQAALRELKLAVSEGLPPARISNNPLWSRFRGYPQYAQILSATANTVPGK
jgi:eukaryotic-like serine/threonine-protein kinase